MLAVRPPEHLPKHLVAKLQSLAEGLLVPWRWLHLLATGGLDEDDQDHSEEHENGDNHETDAEENEEDVTEDELSGDGEGGAGGSTSSRQI